MTVTPPPDPPYEILDFGSGSLPEATGQPRRRPPRPDLGRWVNLGLAFVVGAGIGGYVWGQWRDHEESVTEAASVVLVGGLTSAQPHEDGTVAFSLVLENLGPKDLRIDELMIEGWSRLPDQEPLDVLIPSHKSVAVADVAVVDCAARVPTEVSARVRTADGVSREAQIRLPGDPGSFGWPHSAICAGPEGHVWVRPETVIDKGPDYVRTVVVITNSASQDIRINGVITASEGYDVEPVGLPWTVAGSRDGTIPSETRAEVVWRVRDCAAAQTAYGPEFHLELTTDTPGPSFVAGDYLSTDPAVTAELIRLGITACDKS